MKFSSLIKCVKSVSISKYLLCVRFVTLIPWNYTGIKKEKAKSIKLNNFFHSRFNMFERVIVKCDKKFYNLGTGLQTTQ